MTRIMIGMPTADGDVELPCMQAVLNLVGKFAFTRPDTTFDLVTTVSRDLVGARNAMANRLLEVEDYSHLLFIDADMGFAPDLIERMIDADLPMVGTVAPQRHRDLDAMFVAAQAGGSAVLTDVLTSSYTPAMHDLDFGVMDARHSTTLVRARQTGTGILLIARTVFQTMARQCPDIAYRVEGVDRVFYDFFRQSRADNGVLRGEDLSFTLRWREACQGEIWVETDALITHSGPRNVTGNWGRRRRLMATTD